MEFENTVLFDFDGVINSYKSGWEGYGIISDPPVEGIKEAIDEIRSLLDSYTSIYPKINFVPLKTSLNSSNSPALLVIQFF